MPAHDQKDFGMLLDQRFYRGDVVYRALEGGIGDGEVDGGDARLPDGREDFGGGRRVHVKSKGPQRESMTMAFL